MKSSTKSAENTMTSVTDSHLHFSGCGDFLTEEERKSVTVIDQTKDTVILYKPKKTKVKKKKNAEGTEKDQSAKSKRKKRSKSKDPFLDGELSENSLELASVTIRASPSEGSLFPLSMDLATHDLEQPSMPKEESTNNVALYQQNVGTHTGSEKDEHASAMFMNRFEYRARTFLKSLLHLRMLKIFQLLCAVYICIVTFQGVLLDAETGLLIDQNSEERTAAGVVLVNGTERAIVCSDNFQTISILIARLTAWFMYPTLVMVYVSKFRATGSFLARSPLAIYMYSDSHELHVYCGWTILVCSLVHTTFHIVRFAVQGNLTLLWTHFSGISGLIIVSSCLLICVPMTLFRKQIRYEIRKNLHYLFITFGIALCFHTPASAVPNGGFSAYIFGTLLSWYFLDALHCYFFMTEKIDTTQFSVLPSGVRMTMDVSEKFQRLGNHGGICYVCLPWISKNQWHAFSLFENPSKPTERQIFISKAGDWTAKVHRTLQRETVRPAWINGPYPSPYKNAEAYDNQILVASGIGITPALSVIRAHKNTRRINLIWVVRDEYLLHFFLQHLYLDHQGWNLIFYTGKSKLRDSNIELHTNTNVCIIEGRPKFCEVIPNIIYGIESGLGLPDRYHPDTKLVASEMIAQRYEASQRETVDGLHVAEDVACYASELGYHLPTKKVDSISHEFAMCFHHDDLNVSPRTTDTIMSSLAVGFRPWDRHDDARMYVKGLDKNLILPTWGILYCGGAKVVEEELRKISDEFRIGLHVESFTW